MTNPGIKVSLVAGESGVDMVMPVDLTGPLMECGSPSDEIHDELATAIVRGVCDHIDFSEPGIARFYIRK